jgi:succinylglutamate desuccinylase
MRLNYNAFCKLPEFLLEKLEKTPTAMERAFRYMDTGAHRCFERRHAAHWAWNRMSGKKQIALLEHFAREHEKDAIVLWSLPGKLERKIKAGKERKCR